MNDNNLNSFKKYQTYATYQSRTTQADTLRQNPTNLEYTRPDMMRINQKLDTMLDSLNKFAPSLLEPQQNELSKSQMANKLPQPQYDNSRMDYQPQQQQPQQQQPFFQTISTQKPRTPNLYHSIQSSPEYHFSTNPGYQQDYDDYLQFKEFVKAKQLILNTHAPLQDMYKYYLENDVKEKVRYYRYQQEKVNKIILQK